jgi:hypothetical protein
MIIYGVCAIPYMSDSYQDDILKHFINKDDAQVFADIISQDYRDLVANDFKYDADCTPYTQSEAYVREITVY